MLVIRRAQDRGQVDLGWLQSHHTFSFGHYYDPHQMGFGSLRVINDDVIQPGGGFDTHGHRNMEILTYVLSGALAHKDSIGNGSVIRPGEVQRMSAGTGIYHSEFNGSQSDPVHLLQIWILPDQVGLPPSYEERIFSAAEKQGKLRLIAAADARENSVKIHQDASVYAAILAPGEAVIHPLAAGRQAWIQVAQGSVDINGHRLEAGDGLGATEVDSLHLRGINEAEILLFDLRSTLDGAYSESEA
ncbi:pirin family protein [Synechococcales cyanobacterium C]|uniref:Pirin family protein n=1 Tax=Petrachloros mirabilis ULC683 TaxID=2781853 RepID=A0A8K2A6K1_9CYAN|nr:pirin family protein [Petrachloros mirabilis]NCJ05305.1 pirin family protein [Petrachloros mirabilis ULC683]